MKKVYVPRNDSELVILKSILEEYEIEYFIQNENFGNAFNGYTIPLNEKTIMVDDADYEKTKQIIEDFLASLEN